MSLKEDWENRARALLAEREGEDFVSELRRAHREMIEASFGPVTPEAALKNVEAWQAREKERQQEEIELAALREKQLATPVTVFLDGVQLKLPRLLYEEIENAQWSWCNAGHDFDDTIADVLKPLLRDGFITLVDR